MSNRYWLPYRAFARGIIIAITFGVCIGARSQQQQQPKAGQTQQATQADQRGTEQAPVIVRVLPSPNADEEATQVKQQRQEEADFDGDTIRLSEIVAAIGVLQLLVFGYQAWQLRRSVDKMDEVAQGQTADMASSIAEAAKSAKALEGVANSIRDMAADQHEFWLKQMRAYIGVGPGNIIQQTATSAFEFQPAITNNGLTPAHEVRFRAATDIVQIPIPDTYVFNVPPLLPTASSMVLGPRQTTSIIQAHGSILAVPTLTEIIQTPGGRRMIIYGTITYKDEIGDNHQTDFCFYLVWGSAGVPVWITAHRHNECT